MWKTYTIFLIVAIAQAGIVVSIPDLKNIVEEVYGSEVEVILPGHADPHLYSPSRHDFERVKGADLLILANSEIISFEAEMKELSKKSLDFEDYNAKILEFPGIGKNYHAYWLYPENAIKIAEKVTEKLIEMYPEREEFYRLKFERFAEKIRDAERDAKKIVASVKDYDFIAMDPHVAYAISALDLKLLFVFPEEIPPAFADIPKKKGDCIVVIAEYQKGTKLEEIGRKMATDIGCGIAFVDVMSEIDYSSRLILNAAKLSNPEFKREERDPLVPILGALALSEAFIIVFLWRSKRKI